MSFTRDLWMLWHNWVEQIVQRQLQLRIEAQGKYLKKIIEEQQRLSGVLSEVPAPGASAPLSGDNCPESDNKTDPSTPAPTSESPFLDSGPTKERAPVKCISADESFSSRHEPLTPDSASHVSSIESPKGEVSEETKSEHGCRLCKTRNGAYPPNT